MRTNFYLKNNNNENDNKRINKNKNVFKFFEIVVVF